ncbi:MAG: hypothetical protein AAFY28_20945 [Actinomycetota bacterium]
MLVVGVAAGYLVWGGRGDGSGATNGDATATLVEAQTDRLRPGRDYYVFIKTVELYPTQPDGGAWDRIDGSAPDVRYALTWQGLDVFEAETRSDTLIGVWDPISVDVREALPVLGDGRLELASVLNRGAIVNVSNDAEVIVKVWDQDPPGLRSDAAGQVTLRLAELREGDTELMFEASEVNAIKRIVVGATDTSRGVRNLVEALSAPRP